MVRVHYIIFDSYNVSILGNVSSTYEKLHVIIQLISL